MALQKLQFMQDEIRRQIGRAVCRLNTQGADINRSAIIETLRLLIQETDDRKQHRILEASIELFIVTNGKFVHS